MIVNRINKIGKYYVKLCELTMDKKVATSGWSEGVPGPGGLGLGARIG